MGNTDAQLANLLRRASSRFARIATWNREEDGDLHDWVVEKARAHVTEYGPTELALDSPQRDRIAWRAQIATVHEEVVLRSADPMALVEASWKLTFRAAHMMLEATSAAPRLMSEVGNVYTEAIKAMKDAISQSENVSVAAVTAEASSKKLDQMMGLIKHFGSDGDGNGRDFSGASTPARAAVASRDLLGSITPDDLPDLLAHPLGQALAVAQTWSDLQQTVAGLFKALDTGEITLSLDSREAARAVVKLLNE